MSASPRPLDSSDPALVAADAALHHAFARIANDTTVGADSRTALCEAIWSYVDIVRATQVLPERMVVDIKRIATAAGVQSIDRWPENAVYLQHETVRDAVQWSIARYFADQP